MNFLLTNSGLRAFAFISLFLAQISCLFLNIDSKNLIADFTYLAFVDIILFFWSKLCIPEKHLRNSIFLAFMVHTILALFYLTFSYLLPLGGDSINPIITGDGFFDAPGYESSALEIATNRLEAYSAQPIASYFSYVYKFSGKNAYLISITNSFLIYVSLLYLSRLFIRLGFPPATLLPFAYIPFIPEIAFYASLPGKEAVSMFIYTMSLIFSYNLIFLRSAKILDIFAIFAAIVFVYVRPWNMLFALGSVMLVWIYIYRRSFLLFIFPLVLTAVIIWQWGPIFEYIQTKIEFASFINTNLPANSPIKSFIRLLLQPALLPLLPIVLVIKYLIYLIANYPLLPSLIDFSYVTGNNSMWIFFHQFSLFITGALVVAFILTGLFKRSSIKLQNLGTLLSSCLLSLLLYSSSTLFIHVRYRYPVLLILFALLYVLNPSTKAFVRNLLLLFGFSLSINLLYSFFLV
jgi:hypothetical protein